MISLCLTYHFPPTLSFTTYQPTFFEVITTGQIGELLFFNFPKILLEVKHLISLNNHIALRVVKTGVLATLMHGSRTLCQRGSNKFFLVDEEREDPKNTKSGPSLKLPAKRHLNGLSLAGG